MLCLSVLDLPWLSVTTINCFPRQRKIIPKGDVFFKGCGLWAVGAMGLEWRDSLSEFIKSLNWLP